MKYWEKIRKELHYMTAEYQNRPIESEYTRGVANGLILARDLVFDIPWNSQLITCADPQMYEIGKGRLSICNRIPELIQCNHSSTSMRF